MTELRLLPAGDTALVAELGNVVDHGINARVLALAERVEKAAIPGVVELVPTFRSLMIHFDPLATPGQALRERVAELAAGLEAAEISGRDWVLPACYEGEHAPDLEFVARATKLDPAEVVAIHSTTLHQVYCLGFLPGYPYMGELPADLDLPRRESPRVRVPMGAICTAMRLTGIYSLESPGGWHLLGRTPVRLFDLRRTEPVLLKPGDRVRFEPIGLDAFAELDARAAADDLPVFPVPSPGGSA